MRESDFSFERRDGCSDQKKIVKRKLHKKKVWINLSESAHSQGTSTRMERTYPQPVCRVAAFYALGPYAGRLYASHP